MIKRYTLPKMEKIWTEENKFQKFCEVEILACEAMARLGMIPKKAASTIRRRARFDIDHIKEIEAKTHHDVIAFLIDLGESVGEDSKYIHKGLTSSDVLDTALSVMMREAAEILHQDLNRLCKALRKKAHKYRHAVMMGRSHGVHAEPVTFGLKMALFYDEMKRNIARLKEAKETVSVGKISGAVGTYANIDPRIEEYVCKKLKLKPARISTQVLQRDRHAHYMSTLAIIGASLEKLAVEIRHLHRTEVGEVEEPFAKGQKGSSAMPHKKNPIVCERVTGLARVLRGNAMAAMENVALWHERDISHSSVERVIVPDSTILLDYMLEKMVGVIDGLVVNTDAMAENLSKNRGIIFSQRVLLELINKGLDRFKAYDLVQQCAHTMEGGFHFKEALMGNSQMRRLLTKEEIEACFDMRYHTKHVDRIFKKVGI